MQIITITPENAKQYKLGCINNPQHAGFKAKYEWLEERMKEGLVIKLFIDENGKPGSFIEYVPGEYAWRTVSAQGYFFIHCLWTQPKANMKKGYASVLINECIADAERADTNGVAVVTSEGTWISGKKVFINLGFAEIAHKDRFDLLVKKFKNVDNPRFTEFNTDKYQGLHLLYAAQCPYAVSFMNDIKKYCEDIKVEITITKLSSPVDAQHNPSVFGTGAVIHNGKVMADHPVSKGRFKNIVTKELKLTT